MQIQTADQCRVVFKVLVVNEKNKAVSVYFINFLPGNVELPPTFRGGDI